MTLGRDPLGRKPAPAARDGRYEFILSTAAALVHEHGYQAVSMRGLAKAVGIKMPSVYYHFESKEQIPYAISRRTMVALIELTQSELEALAGAPVADRLTAALRTGVRFHTEHQAEAGVVLSEVRHLTGDYAADLRQLMRDYEQIFYNLVMQGMEEGVFVRHDPTMATYIMLSALTRISIWYRHNGRLPSQAIEDEYSSLLVGMLQAAPTGNARPV